MHIPPIQKYDYLSVLDSDHNGDWVKYDDYVEQIQKIVSHNNWPAFSKNTEMEFTYEHSPYCF